ncbi:MAG: S8 family peptidase [Gemmatimonadaceae bacterium]
MLKRRSIPLILGILAAACSDGTSGPAGAALAPMTSASVNQTDDVVPNEYIVVLKQGSNVAAEAARARASGALVMDMWTAALHGFAVRASGTVLQSLRGNQSVSYIQPNYILRVSAVQTCAPYTTCPWGLDRIDETSLPMDGVYNQPVQAPNQGAGVHAYSIDTGIRITHADFGGRAAYGFNATNPANPPDDNNGHGTHTSGTIGGATYGVAKRVNLVAVKVCGAFGLCATNAIVSGVNWVTTNAIKPAVANMSLGGGINAAIDQAVSNSIASGVVYAIAAGNNAADACQTSPAHVPEAITVAASGDGTGIPPASIDTRANFSNFGTCVDLFAPGTNILSATNTSDNATAVLSGTSMATPHVAGAAALYLDIFPNKTPAQVAAAIVANATPGVIVNPGVGSPNLLLNVNKPHRP